MIRPLRVMYVLNSAGGGATQGIVEMLRGLPQEQYEAYLVVPHRPDERQQTLFSSLAKQTFVVPMTWWNRKTNLPLLWRMPVWGRGALRTRGRTRPVWALCDLIRAHQIDLVYTNTGVMLDGALAARLCGVPHLWHIKEWIGQRGRVKFWLPDALLARFITKMSVRVVVMTRFIGEIFARFHLEDKVSLVYDGVDTQSFERELNGEALRQQLGIQEGQFLVGMAASLSSTWKQHNVFMQMAALLASRFPNVRFAAFGPEPKQHGNPAYNLPWQYYQGLKEEVSRLGLDEKFIWAGFHPNIPQIMDALDILVHPCDIEPFGRVAIEAMAAQCSVVGPNRGGIAESVIDGETGFLVAPGDAAAFAGATARLVADPDLRRRMGMAGRAHVVAHFSLERHVQQISDIYEQVYSARHSLSPARNAGG